jgi:hypothetical protein
LQEEARQDEVRTNERLRFAAPFAIPTAALYGLVSYTFWYPENDSQKGFAFVGILLSLPITISSLAVIFGDPRGSASTWRHAGLGALGIIAAIILSFLLLGESGFCAVMAAPIYFVIGPLAGVATGLLLRHFRARTLSCLSLILPFAVLPIDPQLQYPSYSGSVTTVVDIAAPASAVWQNTVEIRHVRPAELPWTFSHAVVGVPQPVDARLEGHGVGAIRYLEWSQGVHFQEHITEWSQDRLLGWRFHFEPGSIPAEVERQIKVNSDYLHLFKGSYQLEPLPNGHTRVTLTTEYRIATPINGYCAWWGDIFLNDFHGAVLKVIQERSERSHERLKGLSSRAG